MNYDVLKAAIQAVIKENGNQEITGEIMQQVLLSMINTLGSGATFAGVALTSTNPGTPDPKYFYVANGAGTYPNFNNIVVGTNELAFFINPGGTWQKQSVSFTNIGVEIADNLTTESTTAALSAKQGVVLKALIDNLNEYVDLTVEEINDAIAKKADQDGTYPNLVAGAAQNLVGHGSVLAEFTRRTSGGMADIGTGTAQITKMLGNSIVWNQFLTNGDFSDGTPGWFENGVTLAVSGGVGVMTALSAGTRSLYRPLKAPVVGHKYLVIFTLKADAPMSAGCGYGGQYFPSAWSVTTEWKKYAKILTASSIAAECYVYGVYENTDVKLYAQELQIFDLTLMRWESATESDFMEKFPLDYYAVNVDGVVLNNKSTGLQTDGLNQWDEEWESGCYTEQGIDFADSHAIRTKNFISVFPGTTYYWKKPYGGRIYYYDINRQLIRRTDYLDDSQTFTTPENCYFIKFFVYSDIDNYSYNHDICINLSWGGYRNGEYEPYWKNILPFKITTMKGKLNGEGASVTIYPDGMRGFDSVYDEYTKDLAVKSYVEVDLGDLDWIYSAGDGLFWTGSLYSTLAKKNLANIICAKYANSPTVNSSSMPDKSIVVQIGYAVVGEPVIKIKDSAYTDAATFKTAMSGVKLIYQLNTPETYILDEEQGLNYRVDDFGTETQLPQNTSTPTTAPILYEVQYAMNAVDTLRRLPQNYISKESMENLLTAMQNAGLFSAFTMVWNATTQKYDFTINV